MGKVEKIVVPGRLCVVRHDSEKLLLVDLPVLVEVKLVYHRLSGPPVNVSPRKEDHKSAYNLATRLRLRMDLLPVLSSSKSWNAPRISPIGSRAKILSVTGFFCPPPPPSFQFSIKATEEEENAIDLDENRHTRADRVPSCRDPGAS